jgi:hypothetical protein
MALQAGEKWAGGFVVDATGSVVFTTSTVGAQWQGGFLRDADGRLVVRYGSTRPT